jgi:hypothetical protein
MCCLSTKVQRIPHFISPGRCVLSKHWITELLSLPTDKGCRCLITHADPSKKGALQEFLRMESKN